MIPAEFGRTRLSGIWPIVIGVAVLGLALQLFTAGNYGIFRDELYYLDCANHLDWGYVDHPPLSIAALKIWVTLFGDSLLAVRTLAALAGATLVVLVGLLTARMGGGRFAVFWASLVTLAVPTYLSLTGFFSMNALDLVFWAAAYLALAQLLAGGPMRLWLWFGVVIGLALQNKIGIVALGVGLVPALWLTGNVHHLKSRRFWLGGLLAALMFLPHVLWQIAHDWPTVEFVRNASAGKIVALSLPQYFSEQVLIMNPGLLAFWLLGLLALFFWPRLRPWQALGVLWLIAFLFYGLQRSKAYYLTPAYPPLFAAAACILAHWFKKRLQWMRVVLVMLVIASGAFVAPLAIPLLSPESLLAYMDWTGIQPSAGETSRQAQLPQYFADRFGWENMATTVAEVYRDVPDSLRAECLIVASNYGEAGAINYFGRRYRLPRACSQHNSYYLWGTGDASGEVVLAVNYHPDDLRRSYESVVHVGTVISAWAMPYETDVYIHLCRGLKVPWAQAWQEGRFYY